MSMLAEPRRKQKWSVDPRNSAWSKDESKFGQKMLERMGWSKGKGLGRTEQGSTEHIKVKVKNNQLGLGTTASHEDNWIAHQDDFNQLLADLNNCHGQNTANEAPSEEKQQEKSFSLEEKSKTSRKRVHYMKFTKGKDLSSRSQTDLACIFGKRGTKRIAEDQEEESSGPDSQGMNEKETRAVTAPATKVTTPEPDVEAITKTVTSNLSMQEYFAQRMAQLKRGRGEAPTATSSPETSDTQQVPADFVPDHTEELTSKKKKKKKRRKREREEDDVVVVKEECVVDPVSEGREKKRKGEREEDDVVVMKEECVVAPVSEGREKKRKGEREEDDVVVVKQECVVAPVSEGREKKRKGEREEDDVVVVKEECVVAPVSEGREKKRKGEREEDDVVVVVKEECVVAPVSEGREKKRQRKRAEKEVLAEDCSATTGVEQNYQDRQIVDLTTECEVVNKKWGEEVVVVEDEVIAVKEKKSKKDKKKKKKRTDLHSL
ncbi:PIN2/TERF1-interacting telomerase inhibitor 1 isoform X2 [Oncorhynchus mykiss]|uniref:PIN2 (TERF1) interacting telomerase inhibitor 1 n=1 Tax=Oncorhynchus mykiss TaxID=8022 RepID=A0A8C7SHH3_ONCMY|nr:PIN2/TERF1-interacting telomerase inhibitor 1 isoform X2 [Oncorhynchus mykiss]